MFHLSKIVSFKDVKFYFTYEQALTDMEKTRENVSHSYGSIGYFHCLFFVILSKLLYNYLIFCHENVPSKPSLATSILMAIILIVDMLRD